MFFQIFRSLLLPRRDLPGGAVVKNPPNNAGDTSNVGSIPGSEISPGVGNSIPFQYSCLESSVDRGTWQATVHGVTKNQTRLSVRVHTHTHTHTPTHCLGEKEFPVLDFLLFFSCSLNASILQNSISSFPREAGSSGPLCYIVKGQPLS